MTSGDRVLAALSGGPDSTALVAALAALRDRGLLEWVGALHVNHRLRAGVELDAQFCDALCRKLAVPLECVEVTVEPGNVQQQARRARYEALRRAAARSSAGRIATGHTRSDQAETVLLRLLRGSGARGLSAIPPRRGPVIRPLIDRSREEVLAFLRDLGLDHRVDPTNASPRFLRNRVRSELIPALRKLSPGAEGALARAADLAREDERALDRAAKLLMENGSSFSSARFRSAPVAVRKRIVRRLWLAAAGTRKGLLSRHVDAVLHLARRRAPGRAMLPLGFEARCAYGKLAVARPAGQTPSPASVEVPGPGIYRLGAGGPRLAIEAAPGVLVVSWPLWLRTRGPGDRFRPAQRRGSKSLKRWLIDRKVPREQRDSLALLVDGAGQVLWIPELGVRSALADSAGLRLRVLDGAAPMT